MLTEQREPGNLEMDRKSLQTSTDDGDEQKAVHHAEPAKRGAITALGDLWKEQRMAGETETQGAEEDEAQQGL